MNLKWFEIGDIINESQGSIEWLACYIKTHINELTEVDIQCLIETMHLWHIIN